METKTFKELYEMKIDDYTGHITKEYERDGVKKEFTLSYLPWADAVRIMSELDPGSSWDVREWDGQPWLNFGPGRGGMVHVTVTLYGKKRETFLPIMDAKYDPIPDPDAFDINTAIMRGIAKALALHGVGLSLYKKDEKGAAGSAAKQMAPGANGEAVKGMVLTLVKVLSDLGGKGAKVVATNDAGEEVKLTCWSSDITLPKMGEKVSIDGVWKDEGRYGTSITAKAMRAPAPAEPKQPELPKGDTPEIPDTPANRAAVLKKLKTLITECKLAAINAPSDRDLENLSNQPDTNVAQQLTDLGLALRAALDGKRAAKTQAKAAESRAAVNDEDIPY